MPIEDIVNHYIYDPKTIASLAKDAAKCLLDILQEGELKQAEVIQYLRGYVLSYYPFINPFHAQGVQLLSKLVGMVGVFLCNNYDLEVRIGLENQYFAKKGNLMSPDAEGDVKRYEQLVRKKKDELKKEKIERMISKNYL